MATFNLTWTPAGGATSTGQEVWSRPVGGTYVRETTLSNAANSHSLTLSDNQVYDFKIVNLCSAGGSTETTPVSNAVVTCVGGITTSNVTESSFSVSFAHLKASVDRYTAVLRSGATLVDQKQQTGVLASVDTITFNFTGLTPGQSYDLEVSAGIGTSYNKTCAKGTVATSVGTCYTPTNLVATAV
jgi:fructose-1,6-bisphosphatase/sedoheptulose 1,7-bisphosphatase-like protein